MIPRLSEFACTRWSSEHRLSKEKYTSTERLVFESTAPLAIEEDFNDGFDDNRDADFVTAILPTQITSLQSDSSDIDLVSPASITSSCNYKTTGSNLTSPHSVKSSFHFIAILHNKILSIEYRNADMVSRKGSASRVLASIAHHKGNKYRRFSCYPHPYDSISKKENCELCGGKCAFRKIILTDDVRRSKSLII